MGYVILVDDDEDFARAAAKVLRHAGHEVRVELEVPKAVASMEARRPDLAILDVMFPESSSAGFELARTMRHHNPRLKGIPILFLTAVNAELPLGFSTLDLDESWLPAEGFLEKPLDLDILLRKVAELLQASGRSTGQEAATEQGPRTSS